MSLRSEISRRHLFRCTAGTLALSSSGRVLDARTNQSGLSISPAVESIPSPVSTEPIDTYRLFSKGGMERTFGMVGNLSEHLKFRQDVKREILYWLTDGRSSFLGATGRFQFLENTVRPMYRAAGIPEELGFGLGMQESLFRNYSVSYANAKGIWQMQWAGRKYGLRGGDYFDIVKSTRKQLEYLKDLVRTFDQNLELVLVDYNYGPGKRFRRYRSDPNAFRRIYHRIPRQTRRFVPRILAAIAIGIEPERYGLFIPTLDSRTIKISIPREIHHLELGLLLGVDHWNLGNLNPRTNVRAWFKEGETVFIPKVNEATYHKNIDGHPLRKEFYQFVADVYPSPGKDIKYTVKRGDNLSSVAREFQECGVQGPQHIMLSNGLTSTVIYPGQQLTIPCAE